MVPFRRPFKQEVSQETRRGKQLYIDLNCGNLPMNPVRKQELMEKSFCFIRLYHDCISMYSIILLRFRIDHTCLLWPVLRSLLRCTHLREIVNYLPNTSTHIHSWSSGSIPNESYSNHKPNMPKSTLLHLCSQPKPISTAHGLARD